MHQVHVVLCGIVAVASLTIAVTTSSVVKGITHTANSSGSTYLRVIVVGATGDLAAKYLWVACFRLALEVWLVHNQRVLYTAAARDSKERGEQWMRQFFTPEWPDRVCGDATTTESTLCRAFYTTHFLPAIHYAKVETAADYEVLASMVRQQDEQLHHEGLLETGRLAYLAIPPQVFLQASQSLSMYLRPTDPDAFFRVVIEKPFGRDLPSATLLASKLREVLNDDEMLLMDHYAGKPGLRVIDPFVRRNAQTLARIWNGKFIRNIDIEMSETETCEHRLDYFDSNGIIRDVMVNHLQLVIGIVVAPSLPHCVSSRTVPSVDDHVLDDLCPREMTRFLESLRWIEPVVIGQYEGYNRGVAPVEAHRRSRSVTATAAHLRLQSTQTDWAATSISMAAAKATGARKASVKITFKMDPSIHDDGKPCSIEFTIQNGVGSSGEQIRVQCAALVNLTVPSPWSVDTSGVFVHHKLSPSAWQLGNPPSAYDSLVHDAVHGRVDNFMKIDEVLASWKLWSPIVQAAELLPHESIVTYPIGTKAWRQVEGTCPLTIPWVQENRHHRDAEDTTPIARGIELQKY